MELRTINENKRCLKCTGMWNLSADKPLENSTENYLKLVQAVLNFGIDCKFS